jgi:hypothetical protein
MGSPRECVLIHPACDTCTILANAKLMKRAARVRELRPAASGAWTGLDRPNKQTKSACARGNRVWPASLDDASSVIGLQLFVSLLQPGSSAIQVEVVGRRAATACPTGQIACACVLSGTPSRPLLTQPAPSASPLLLLDGVAVDGDVADVGVDLQNLRHRRIVGRCPDRVKMIVENRDILYAIRAF